MKTLIQFIKFGLTGAANTVIYYGIYILLIRFNVNYIIASVIGFAVGMANSFFWNNRYVFKKEQEKNRSEIFSAVKMVIAYVATSLVLQNLLLALLVSKLYVSKYFAPVLILTVTVPLNFLTNKFWAFRESKKMEK